MRFFKYIIFCTILVTLQVVMATPEDITKAAQDGLQKFLQCIPKNMVHEYGFHDVAELESCELGKAFQVQIITPQALQNYQPQDTVKSLMEDSGMWYFTITCKGENRAMLVVAKAAPSENWEAVSFGNLPLAHELQNVQRAWTNDRGFDPQLIIVFQARKYLFHLPQLDSENITTIDLHPVRAIDYLRTESITTIVSSLHQEVQNNIDVERTYLKSVSLQQTKELAGTSTPGILQVLNVPQVYQRYDQWCWAGCSESIFKFYGKNIEQNQIAQEGTRGLNIWNWLWGVTNNPYRKGIQELLTMGNLRSSGLNYALSESQLQSQISSQKPFVVRWGWDNGGGHFVVCKGFNGSTTYIMDPWSGPTVNTYSWLRRGNGHTWTSTLTTSQ